MDYDRLVYKLGSLHTMLRELEAEGLFQGEHTISFSGADGVRQTLHIYIDGTDLQMSSTPGTAGSKGISFSLDASPGND